MKISIFGLGYVGAVSAACLTKEGHTVLGVDPNVSKVDVINAGNSPIIEAELGSLIAQGVESNLLSATTNAAQAIASTEVSIICVGTPSMTNGSLDLRFVRQVCEEIGESLREKNDFHVIVARSTMLPGSMREVVIPVLESSSGKRAGTDFGVCFNPEFLREGSAVKDFFDPPKTVVGESDQRSGDALLSLYEGFGGQIIRTDIETAEMVKYVDNTWHALKVGFGNEVGNLCKRLNLDGQKVMSIFCEDTKLNLSSQYLRPGFAFGGSCLPKDLRAIGHRARMLDVSIPIIEAVLPSNQQQIEIGLNMVQSSDSKQVGVLGFSFKAGTDDLRESPMVELIERLLGKGYNIKIYDKNVELSKLVGANRDYIFGHIPHIARLMVPSMSEVVDHSKIIVIGNSDPEFITISADLRADQKLIDLTGIARDHHGSASYEGICW